MNTRPLRQSDVPVLKAMAEASGFPYPEPDAANLAAVVVVVDDEDRPIMAAAAEPIIQAYLWCKPSDPHQRLAGLRLLHEGMAECLKQKGYNSIEAFIPPTLAERFGKRLARTFGWTRNWQSWNRAF